MLKVNPRFKGTCCLHLQGHGRWRQHVSPKRQLTFNGLHGIISQKIELFITTAVRTSSPTIIISDFYNLHTV
jgi:hypothetical protein